MLATLVIGLREGLEAALIVGIIAAFLRRSGRSLRAMWIGVGAAVLLSIAVGVILQIVSADLPQAQQEGMETIIGLVAVGFVTGMIGWMNRHARTMRHELEASAEHALHDGTKWALVAMAFLAVLKEGFETSVFLLAAFQSSGNAVIAGLGAIIGIAVAVAIGIGVYRGGVRINLGRFFRVTGLFLVLVAAGLVMISLRTAHEAGWITIGQQTTLNLAWMAPNGSVQAALLTGVLGIPSDPRFIEVLGWALYLVPVLIYLLWPASRRPAPHQLARLRFGIAAGLAIVALALASLVPLPGAYTPGRAPLVSADGQSVGTAELTSPGRLTTTVAGTTSSYDLGNTVADHHNGQTTRLWQQSATHDLTAQPSQLSITQLMALSGGRLPIGINSGQNPGPFAAHWQSQQTTSVWLQGGILQDAQSRTVTTLTVSGGGLDFSHTITVDRAAASPSWTVTPTYVVGTIADAAARASLRAELLLWKLYIPVALGLAALVLCAYAMRSRWRARRDASAATPVTSAPEPRPTADLPLAADPSAARQPSAARL